MKFSKNISVAFDLTGIFCLSDSGQEREYNETVQLLFTDFRNASNSVCRKLLHGILAECTIIKLLNQVNGTYRLACIINICLISYLSILVQSKEILYHTCSSTLLWKVLLGSFKKSRWTLNLMKHLSFYFVSDDVTYYMLMLQAIFL
jgi:hypothetical protein